MKQETLSRRKMLKTLAAAGGGLTAAAFLPAKWVKPVVQSGVLPVHAQASAAAYCDSGKWSPWYWHWQDDQTMHFISVEFPPDFPKDETTSIKITGHTGGVNVLGEECSATTYLYEGESYGTGSIWADFNEDIALTDLSGDWSVTFKVTIAGCEETATVDNNDDAGSYSD